MKNIKNILLRVCFAAGLMLVASGALAQQKMTVSGTVKDIKGEPIIGAAVLLEGTSNGAVTDVDGKYTLTFTSKGKDTKLVYSSMAYLSQTIAVGNRSVIDVVLQDDAEQLDEVVVVGYGSMRRSDLTGSVTSVKIDETQAAQSASLDQLLQGHAAGVQVVSNSASPDAGVNITIRGASSFNANSQPLYVVDGVIMNTDSSASLYSHAGGDAATDEDTNGLMGISPNDIASMEILKDASATAIYGSQGANGVVLITTKSANREKPIINFSAGVDFSRLAKKFNVLTAANYTDYLALKGFTPTSSNWTPYTEGIANGTYEAVDWQDYATTTGISQRYYLSIAARPKNTSYRLSINYNDNQGIIKGTGMNNITIRLNLDKTIGRVKFGTKTSVSYLKSKLTQGTAGSRLNAATSMVTSMVRTRPLRYIGTAVDDEGDEYDDEDHPLSGPERWLTDFQSERTEVRVTPSIYAEVKILPWLTFKSTFGADYRVTDQLKFKSQRLNTESTKSNGANVHDDRVNWNWDNLLLFNQKWGKHSISGTLGQSSFYKSAYSQTVEGTEVAQWKAMAAALNAAPNVWLSYGESFNSQLSFFARAIYNYADRYVLTATYRFDGSSKFAGKNKWAQFPSVALAWRINQEPWFNVPVISSAKLRVGWGVSGNDGVPAYQTIYTYSTGKIASHDNTSSKNLAVYSTKLPSYDLKWESTEQVNVGLDIGLWKGRFTLEADWYKKDTKDLLQTKVVPGSAGVNNPYVNMGCITNSGLEFTVNATPVLTKDFEWNIGGNISFNRNRITSIDPSGASSDWIYLSRHDTEPTFVEFFNGDSISGGSICRSYVNKFITGQPMALFYGLATDGLVPAGGQGLPWEGGTDSDYRGEGAVNYLDLNGDGKISTLDCTIIGNPNPDFVYGFNTSFRFRRLTLSANFTGSQGNDIYNIQNMVLSDMSNTANLLYAATLGAWTLENQTSKWPKVTTASSYSDLNIPSDRFVEDGSYLRLSNVTLSYDFKIKNKNSFLKGLNVGVSGKNLVLWTKYSGYDPDVNTYGSVKRKGCDAGAYPSARTYMFDVKFTF